MDLFLICAMPLAALYVVVKVAHRKVLDWRERQDIEQQIASLHRNRRR